MTRRDGSEQPRPGHPGWAPRLLWQLLLWAAALAVLALIGGLVRFALYA